jgi:hypothetical protein
MIGGRSWTNGISSYSNKGITIVNEVIIEGERKAIRYDPSKMTLQVAGSSSIV